MNIRIYFHNQNSICHAAISTFTLRDIDVSISKEMPLAPYTWENSYHNQADFNAIGNMWEINYLLRFDENSFLWNLEIQY